MKYRLFFYETSTQQPVEKFIKSLQVSAKAKITKEFNLLKMYGPELAMPHAKPMGAGLFELRIRDKQEVRILYIFVSGADIYALHAFIKKRNSIPKKELEIAKSRATEIKNIG